MDDTQTSITANASQNATCGGCAKWSREIGHYLGYCMKTPHAPRRDVEGRLIRTSFTRSRDRHACFEPRQRRA